MVPAMLAWTSAMDPYFLARFAGGSCSMLMLMLVIVKFGKSAGTLDLSNFKKKCFFSKKKVFCFLKENIFFGTGP